MIIPNLTALLINQAWEKYKIEERWKTICEKHLVANDPRSEEQQQLDDEKEREDRRKGREE